MLKGFKDFLLRGNIVELAIAVVIGTAFTALVMAFTTSFLEPLIGLLGGGGVEGGTVTVNGQVFTWGFFLNAVITFVLTAAILYFLVMVPMKGSSRDASAARKPGRPSRPRWSCSRRSATSFAPSRASAPGGDPSGPGHDQLARRTLSRQSLPQCGGRSSR